LSDEAKFVIEGPEAMTNHKELDLIKTALGGFSLSDVESSVYYTVLNLGSRPAAKIAKHAGLSRTYAYDVLGALSEKGLVQEIEKNSVRHYSPTPPSELLGLIQEQEERLAKQKRQLENALPSLERLQTTISGDPSIRTYQGLEGMKKVLDDTLKQGEDPILGYCQFGLLQSSGDSDVDRIRARHNRLRIKRGIWHNVLCPEHEYDDVAPTILEKQLIQVKTLKGLNMPAEIMVYGEKAAVFPSGGRRVAMVVQNTTISLMLQSLHQTIWEILS
jgi:sugar-specific transcriptional regulator TrmB